MEENTKTRFICRTLLESVGSVFNAVIRILGKNRLNTRVKMVKQTNEEFNTPEVTPEVNSDSKCACDKLKEIGFHRCKDDIIYITLLCEECQKIKIKKYKLELLGELLYG